MAFDVFQPTLRSLGGISEAARRVFSDEAFKETVRSLLRREPEGTFYPLNLPNLAGRVQELERRLDKAPNDNPPSALESEIVEYLRRHPNAADTLEGISEWWVLQTRTDKVKKDLEAALRNLVAKELVRSIRGADGRVTYRVGAKKQDSRTENR